MQVADTDTDTDTDTPGTRVTPTTVVGPQCEGGNDGVMSLPHPNTWHHLLLSTRAASRKFGFTPF